MMKKTVFILALWVMVMLAGNTVHAVTVPFSDGFEVGTPDTYLDAPWYEDTYGFAYDDDLAAVGSQSAHANPSQSRQAYLDITTDATVLELTWWYRSYGDVLANRRLLNATLEDTATGKYGPYLRTIKDASSNRYVQYYTGSSWQNITTWEQGIWYEMKVVLNIDPDDDVKNDTWDFFMRTSDSVPWTQYKDDIVTRDDIDGINRLQFSTTGAGFAGRGGFRIDDVHVIPEPATVVLLGLGSLVGLLRRKRS